MPNFIADGLYIGFRQRGSERFQRVARSADPLHLLQGGGDRRGQAGPFLENLIAPTKVVNVPGPTGFQRCRDLLSNLLSNLLLALLPRRQVFLGFLQFPLSISSRLR